jgi:glycosyltransferase involved in cell wall biosynthesis
MFEMTDNDQRIDVCAHKLKIQVSVVVAAKNESLYVEEALLSIANQSGVSIEIIFVDDNSDDDTYNIATQIALKYTHIRVFRNPNFGKCSAFNYGILQARGEYTCIFAGDDIMPTGSLAERYRVVVNAAGSAVDQPVVGLSKLITMSADRRYDGHIIPRARGKGATSGVSPLMNRQALNLIFPTPEQLPNEDTWMELAVLHLPRFLIVHCDTFCCRWRVHGGNSINMAISFKEYNEKITIRMEALKLFMERFGAQLNSIDRKKLQEKIEIENARRRGDWWAVMTADGALVDRLRALSITNSTLYEFRRRFYGILSGW